MWNEITHSFLNSNGGTRYQGCDYLFTPRFKLNHVSERGPRSVKWTWAIKRSAITHLKSEVGNSILAYHDKNIAIHTIVSLPIHKQWLMLHIPDLIMTIRWSTIIPTNHQNGNGYGEHIVNQKQNGHLDRDRFHTWDMLIFNYDQLSPWLDPHSMCYIYHDGCNFLPKHYCDVIMGAMASQINRLTIAYSTV